MMNEKEKMMKSKVTFLSAKDGKIEITYRKEDGTFNVIAVGSHMEVAQAAAYLDFSEANCSSSMDFADEYGFAFPSEAWSMLNRGLEIA